MTWCTKLSQRAGQARRDAVWQVVHWGWREFQQAGPGSTLAFPLGSVFGQGTIHFCDHTPAYGPDPRRVVEGQFVLFDCVRRTLVDVTIGGVVRPTSPSARQCLPSTAQSSARSSSDATASKPAWPARRSFCSQPGRAA